MILKSIQVLLILAGITAVLPIPEVLAQTLAVTGSDSRLESLIPAKFTHVYRVGDFYILGTDEKPLDTDKSSRTGEEVVIQAVRLFCSLLDADGDGEVDHPELLKEMGEHFAFAVGSDRSLRSIEELLDAKAGRYVISMKTDIWPFLPEWNGKGFRVLRLNTSMWRPAQMNALWEECFHVYTETWRVSSKRWRFDKRGLLGMGMAEDIKNGQYEIQRQNRLEGGDYDWETAVNEYVHQIWVIQNGGHENVLTPAQKRVLEFMRSHKGFPMTMNKDAPMSIAVRVR